MSTPFEWCAFRLCAGYGKNQGKWSIMRRVKAGADIEVGRWPNGTQIITTTQACAERHANKRNAAVQS